MTAHIARKIFLMAGYGMTERQISEVLGISEDTILKAKKDAEFNGAIQRAKEFSDLAVENALYKIATGYEYIEEYYSEKAQSSVAVTKIMHPNIQAIRFWLKNRNKKKWRDIIVDEDPSGNLNVNTVIQIFQPIRAKEAVVIDRGQDALEVMLGKEFVDDLKQNGINGTNGSNNKPS